MLVNTACAPNAPVTVLRPLCFHIVSDATSRPTVTVAAALVLSRPRNARRSAGVGFSIALTCTSWVMTSFMWDGDVHA